MAFPTIRGTPAFSTTAGGTTHTVNLSSSPVAGNLLLLFVSGGGTATITDRTNTFVTNGFTTSLANSEGQTIAGVHHVVAKVATGSEPATITLNTSAASTLRCVCFEIQDWHGTIATGLAAAVQAYVTVTSTWNPPNLDPSEWGTEDTLWLAGFLGQGIIATVTAPGGGYSSLYEDLGGVADRGNVIIHSQNLAAASSDPGAFTTTTIDREGLAFTIAIRPAASQALTKKLKVTVHPSAASATGVEGVVFASSAGIAGAEVGEFTGKTFEATTEGSGSAERAVLKVPVTDFGGGALNVNDEVVVLVRNGTYTTGLIPATIIEEA